MSEKGSHILKQAGILAIAGIVCRIIGVLYRIVLTYIIGDRGNGYYGLAYTAYALLLLITSYSIPGAVSKVMADRLAVREYHNAHKVFRCSLIYVIIVGAVTSVLTFFICPMFVSKETATVLRVFCPTIFFSGILGVYRGYFQAHRTMVQSSVSQIIEQIVNAIVSISMAAVFVNMAEGKDPTTRAVNGAIGSAMGTGAGVLAALIFMLLVYRYNKTYITHKLHKDLSTKSESYGELYKCILAMVTPIILSTFIYNINSPVNAAIFEKVSTSVGLYEKSRAVELYGIFSAKTEVLVNVPIALASALATALLPNIAGTFAAKGRHSTAKQVNDALKILMILVVPITVGLFIFAGPIMKFLYSGDGQWELASSLLRVFSIDVIFISVSTLSNAVLQALGQPTKTLINAFIALVIQTILLVVLLMFTKIGVYALPISTVFYGIVICILNGVTVVKELPDRADFGATYGYPVFASLIMGAVSCGVYLLLFKVYPNNRVDLILTILVAILVYMASILKLGVVGEDELRMVPKGNVIISFAKRIRLLS